MPSHVNMDIVIKNFLEVNYFLLDNNFFILPPSLSSAAQHIMHVYKHFLLNI